MVAESPKTIMRIMSEIRLINKTCSSGHFNEQRRDNVHMQSSVSHIATGYKIIILNPTQIRYTHFINFCNPGERNTKCGSWLPNIAKSIAAAM